MEDFHLAHVGAREFVQSIKGWEMCDYEESLSLALRNQLEASYRKA